MGIGVKGRTSLPDRALEIEEDSTLYPSVKSVKPLEGFKLLLGFANGEHKVFDVTPYLGVGKFAELRDPSLFSSVAVKFDSIEWANHVDIDPEFLYEKSVGLEDDHVTKRSRRHAKARS